MSEGKYRVLKRVGVGINHIETTGTEMHCYQYLFAHNRGWLEDKFTVEENPNYRPSFDEWQEDFIKEMCTTYGVPEFILRPDLSWTDPLKEKTEMKNIDYEAIRKILRNSVVSIKEAVDNLERAMEEVCVMASASPQKIQGYTAEQWQEIIDGGYLCEFGDRGGIWWPGQLSEIPTARQAHMVCSSGEDTSGTFCNCRPAQLKGVMRPIFVEPVDRDVLVIYFDECGEPVSDVRNWISSEISRALATKYIEV